MLLPDDQTYVMADEYASFMSSLVWFKMYCVGMMGKNKDNYIDGFKRLKISYDNLYWNDISHPWSNKEIVTLFEKIESLLSRERFTKSQISEIASLLCDFQNKNEPTFRENFFTHRIKEAAEQFHPADLLKLIDSLMESGEYDAAVITAFKYLDGHLQKLLQVSPYKFYGEDLVNKAFSKNNGVLQLNTTSAEQDGIRNFFSGANAIFRNPSAHRFVVYNRETAGAIIAMVALMVQISSEVNNKTTRV